MQPRQPRLDRTQRIVAQMVAASRVQAASASAAVEEVIEGATGGASNIQATLANLEARVSALEP